MHEYEYEHSRISAGHVQVYKLTCIEYALRNACLVADHEARCADMSGEVGFEQLQPVDELVLAVVGDLLRLHARTKPSLLHCQSRLS